MDKESIKMFEILRENKERVQTKNIIAQQILQDKQRMEKEQKKRNIKTLILGVLIIALGIIMIVLMFKENQQFVKNCVEGGLSENVCRKAA